jgi:murein DD-endopeptidase MepM/ murein hydrolase activator NlpD
VRRVLLVVAVLVATLVPAAARADVGWVHPVDGPVVRPFEPPSTRYGPGHLGVDFRAAPGTAVQAAGPGRVVFAGAVGTTLHVVVLHSGNRRTSYSFLASAHARLGDVVEAGTIVGTTGGTGENHDGSVLHFALRIGATYVDPMQLFGPPDLGAVVHLAPTVNEPAAPAANELPALIDGLPPPDDPVFCRSWDGAWCR